MCYQKKTVYNLEMLPLGCLSWSAGLQIRGSKGTLVNVYVDLQVFTRIAGIKNFIERMW